MNLLRIKNRLDALSTSTFRASFSLGEKELEIVKDKGIKVIRDHARALIAKRLAPKEPLHDGKQTPFRGHPVFIAQHATATCCRNCLFKWHNIPKGRELSQEEQEYIVAVIGRWVAYQIDN